MSRAELIAAFQERAAQLAAEERKSPAAPEGIRGRFACPGSGRTLSDEIWAPTSAPALIDLVYLHGACESADSLPVRNVAASALKRGWRLLVPEHQGHGDSDGKPGVLDSFDGLVADAGDYIDAAVATEGAAPRFAVVGHSMGATVAAYLGGRLRKSYGSRFLGALMIAPAVGADPQLLPPRPVVALLRVASAVLPSLAFPATPFEEPAGYCASDPPPGRNYRGHWPLSMASVVLDLSTKRVPEDCAEGGALRSAAAAFPAVVIKGRGDAMVPSNAIDAFKTALEAAAGAAGEPAPRLVEFGGGHQPLMGPLGRENAEKLAGEVSFLAAAVRD